MGKSFIGIDIGTSEIKFAVTNGNDIQRLVTEPLPDNLVRDRQILHFDAMSDFLKETIRKHRISGRNCAVVLPPAIVFTKTVILPAMTVDQLKLNLPYEFRDFITQEKDKYFYDYSVLNIEKDQDGKPRQMEMLAAATLKTNISECTRMMRRAGLSLKIAVPEEVAYSNLIMNYERNNPQDKLREYCIIDLGHSSTRVHIYTGRRFEVTRVIEYGGALLDSAIAEVCGVDEHIAKTYKIANLNDEQGLETCHSIYRTIAVEIMRAVNFYGFNSSESNLQNAYICGGGTLNRYLIDHIKESVSLNIHGIEELLPERTGNFEVPSMYSAALGVVLQ